jgi:SHAQKYF class myb-like DNA-binding protein
MCRYWTEEEHQRFLHAIQNYGHKDVKAIASLVGTRSATQVSLPSIAFLFSLVTSPSPSLSRKGVSLRVPLCCTTVANLVTSISCCLSLCILAIQVRTHAQKYLIKLARSRKQGHSSGAMIKLDELHSLDSHSPRLDSLHRHKMVLPILYASISIISRLV